MIVKEFFRIREDGVKLYRNYSDSGVCIQCDGEIYDEAIDPENVNRFYTETDIPVQEDNLTAEEALAIITGGEL